MEFESRIFRSVESLAGSSVAGINCDARDLNVYLDVWKAVCSDPNIKQLFKEGATQDGSTREKGFYLKEVEEGMTSLDPETRKPWSLESEKKYREEMLSTVKIVDMPSKEQRAAFDYLKLVSAGVNLFRRVQYNQFDPRDQSTQDRKSVNDPFAIAVVETLSQHLKNAYRDTITPEALQEKIVKGGEILNEALAGEQTDLCSSLGKIEGAGLGFSGELKVSETQTDGLKLLIPYLHEQKFYLHESEKAQFADKGLFKKGHEFKATALGDDVGTFKVLQESKNGGWIVELKAPGKLSRGEITVLNDKHLAGRTLEVGKEMKGFKTGATEKKKIALRIDPPSPQVQKGPESASMSVEEFLLSHGSEKDIGDHVRSQRASATEDTHGHTRMSEGELLLQFGKPEELGAYLKTKWEKEGRQSGTAADDFLKGLGELKKGREFSNASNAPLSPGSPDSISTAHTNFSWGSESSTPSTPRSSISDDDSALLRSSLASQPRIKQQKIAASTMAPQQLAKEWMKDIKAAVAYGVVKPQYSESQYTQLAEGLADKIRVAPPANKNEAKTIAEKFVAEKLNQRWNPDKVKELQQQTLNEAAKKRKEPSHDKESPVPTKKVKTR